MSSYSRLILIPEFRRLIAKIPIAMFVTGREIAFFRPRPLFIRSHPQNDARVPFMFQQLFQPIRLQRGTAHNTAQRMVHAGSQRFFVLADHQIQSPFTSQPVAILDHGRNLVARIDVEQGERHVTEERLPGQP
jgi:hypothetical protein